MACSTCKVRHVKCDETKPVCLKCSNSGRSCDGFSNNFDYRHGSRLNPGLIRGKMERRYFDFFQLNTVTSLIGFDSESSFWTYIVPQFSHSSPAVLHAILATSLLHEHLADGKQNKKTYQLFLQQYNKSIGYIRYQQSNQEASFILTCCILFISVENAQGNYQTALTHLKNGLSILDKWRTNPCTSVSEAEGITEVFRQLDLQATVFLNSRQPEMTTTSGIHKSIPDKFRTMRDAKIALEEIEIRLFYLLTTKSVRQHSEQSRYEMLATRAPLLLGLTSVFSQWKTAFDGLLVSESATMQTNDLQLSVLLALHHQTTSTMLDMRLHLTPCIPIVSSWEIQFARINSLSRSLIHSTSFRSRFNFGTASNGVIAPLYYVAINATTIPVQQQAIELLREVKWTEGLWRAETVSKIAESVYISRVTQSGLPINGGVPLLAQAYLIDL